MAAAAIIARLLQAGTRQGQKAAAALLRMLKKSNPATLEKNIYKEYGNLGRRALSKDILGPLSKFRPPRPGMTKERAMALDRVRKAAKNRLTSDQTSVMRDAARRERRRIEGYERGMREDIKKYGTPMQQDLAGQMRSLRREFKNTSHGFPKGVKNTPGGMKTTKRGFQYRDATPNLGDIRMRAPQRAKTAREIAAEKFTKRSLSRRQDRYLPPSERERLRRMTPEDRDWERRMRDLYEG